MQEAIQLPGVEDSPARARRFLQVVLDGYPNPLIERAQLLLSELVTNAVVHGEPPVVVTVEIGPSALRIEVVDHGSNAPELQEASISDSHGRGLQLVAGLSEQWGIECRTGGKAVWFRLTTEFNSRWSMN